MKQDLYQKITDKIVEHLESTNIKGWSKPWSFITNDQYNAISGKRYRGINHIHLALVEAERGYTSNLWLTFKQATMLGCSVKKGEVSSDIVYFQQVSVPDADVEPSEENPAPTKSFPMIKGFHVFNVDQLDGYDGVKRIGFNKDYDDVFSPIEKAEELLVTSGAVIRYVEGDRAFYTPLTDHITMPLPKQFVSSEAFYAVALHELTHWTGHSLRLNRTFSERSSSKSDYAFEELVAEIGSAFVCGHLGIETQTMDSHVNYLKSWLKVLKQDKKAIFKAAALAQKASDFIIGVNYDFNTESTVKATSIAA